MVAFDVQNCSFRFLVNFEHFSKIILFLQQNTYHRQQQQSPVGSTVSSGTQQRSLYLQTGQPSNIQPINPQLQHVPQANYSASQTSLPHQLQNPQSSKYLMQQQQQQPQHSRPPLPSTSPIVEQLLNHQTGLSSQSNHIIANATSRTSVSSGGNASTVQSVGGGSIAGGSTGQSASSPGGKQEQRLTHEQVYKVTQYLISKIIFIWF